MDRKYVILRGVLNDSRMRLKLEAPLTAENITHVGLLLDEDWLKAHGLVHHRSVFLDDRMHDWDVYKADQTFSYYAHSSERGEAVDIVVFYE
jgi:hypothetical protein